MKTFVFVYKIDNKEYYFYGDDVEGNLLVSDIEDSRIFSQKQVTELDGVFLKGEVMWCNELNKSVILDSDMEKREV